MSGRIYYKKGGKRVVLIFILSALLLSLAASCAPEGVLTLKGEVVGQSVVDRFTYSVATYSISSANNTITFKVRDGWELIPGNTYEFVLQHRYKDEYTAISISQITCKGR